MHPSTTLRRRTNYDSLPQRIKNRRHQRCQDDLHDMLSTLINLAVERDDGVVNCRKVRKLRAKILLTCRQSYKLTARIEKRKINHLEAEYAALGAAFTTYCSILGLQAYNFQRPDGRPDFYINGPNKSFDLHHAKDDLALGKILDLHGLI